MTQTAESSIEHLQASFDALLDAYDHALAELEAANEREMTAARNVAISLLRANRHWLERARDFGTTELPWGSDGFPPPPPMTSDDWEAAQRRAELRVALTPGAADLLGRVAAGEQVATEELAEHFEAVAALAAAHLIQIVEGRAVPSLRGVEFFHGYPALIARLLGSA